ncbi:VWA domain-containing protein [Thiomicrorhabdus sp. 6S2-11]|uniref:VWA domain-containing protein n=1 Tax=Thiomicrorhabdus marina TaxID=2818442 RepID=A0ABS3Q745_9GAMM|nr:VWA domain-containing protein [Thiomicrorhabdus marina]MBO1928181.1 VWA domain-containing protein [Thiomicrorhabdus marina]
MSGLEMLAWRQPEWLWALLLPLFLLSWRWWRQQASQQAYADKHLWPWLKLQFSAVRGGRKLLYWSPVLGLLLAWCSLVIALAGPKIYQQSEQSSPLQGVDIMLVMDLSSSMLIEEQPKVSRFEQAQLLAESFAKQLQPQDRVGLLVFSGSAHLVSPLVFDKSLIVQDLQHIEPGMVPLDGSWLEPAIIQALQHLRINQFAQNSARKIQNRAKAVVVLSDGAAPFLEPLDLPQHVQNVPLQAWLNDDGTQLWMLGIGSLDAKPVPDAEHPSGFKHFQGLPVSSPLQEQSLQQWAQRAKHGVYWRSNGNVTFLQEQLQQLRAASQTQSIQSQQWLWLDIAPWFIGLAFALLLLAIAPHAVWFLLLAALLFGAQQAMAQEVLGEEQQAYQLYQNQEFVEAQQAYVGLSAELGSMPQAYSAWFGAGAAAYKAQDYVSAVRYFRQAAWLAPDDSERAYALFNLGNSYYKADLAQPAVEAYEQALLYKSPFAQAEHNLKIAKQRRAQQLANRGRGEQQGDDAQGENRGKGRQQDGAFYGGQKPNNSQSDEAGIGADGDAEGGNRSGDKPPLPQETSYRNYQLGQAGMSSQTVHSANSAAAQIAREQEQLKNAQQFAGDIDSLQSQQKRLLKRLFEAEAGFHAEQEQTHPIPGVQPW